MKDMRKMIVGGKVMVVDVSHLPYPNYKGNADVVEIQEIDGKPVTPYLALIPCGVVTPYHPARQHWKKNNAPKGGTS